MGTEYYIANPKAKKMFGLGRRLSQFSGLKYEVYGVNPAFSEYECFQDFWIDVLDNNEEFVEAEWDTPLGKILDFLHEVYEFVQDGEVFVLSDCSDNFSKYSSFEEVNSLYKFFNESE